MSTQGCFQVEVRGGGVLSLSEPCRRSQRWGVKLPWLEVEAQPDPEGGVMYINSKCLDTIMTLLLGPHPEVQQTPSVFMSP